jgi:hypothetical protein
MSIARGRGSAVAAAWLVPAGVIVQGLAVHSLCPGAPALAVGAATSAAAIVAALLWRCRRAVPGLDLALVTLALGGAGMAVGVATPVPAPAASHADAHQHPPAAAGAEPAHPHHSRSATLLMLAACVPGCALLCRHPRAAWRHRLVFHAVALAGMMAGMGAGGLLAASQSAVAGPLQLLSHHLWMTGGMAVGAGLAGGLAGLALAAPAQRHGFQPFHHPEPRDPR